jgi:Na+/proline symporter
MLPQARPDISRRFENINLKFDCSTGFEGCFGVYVATPVTGSLLGPKQLTHIDERLRPMADWAGIFIVLIYFLLQYWAIRSADRQTETKSKLSRPFIYSLSVAASGSTWLYYGSTGYAAKYGIEFIGLYIGIVLVFTLGFPLLLRIVELARSEGITSISDFIGARYGKSVSVAAIVTLITTIGLIPYISLQMTAIHYLFDVFGGAYDPHSHTEGMDSHWLVLLMVIGAGYATISYSARSTNFTDRNDGLLNALAVDTVIKFVAFLFIGIALTTFLFGPPAEVLYRVAGHEADIPALQMNVSADNLVALVLIGASSVLLLPSQFYLTVVENRSAKELRMARWFIPLALLVAGLFVIPLARIGPVVLGEHHRQISTFFPCHSTRGNIGLQ